MEKIELGNTGVRVGQLGLGCMQMGTATDEATSFRMLDAFTDAGGDFLDTADCYMWWGGPQYSGGESEQLLAKWLARNGNRDRTFLATKVSGLPVNVPELHASGLQGEEIWANVRFEGAGADTVRRGIDGSLKRLGVEHVDLYYVHVDDRKTPLEETLAALAEVVAAGKARFIGWSNVRTWRLDRVRQLAAQNGWPSPVAVQQRYSYLPQHPGTNHTSSAGEEMLDYLRDHRDVSLVAYSPILANLYDSPDPQGHRFWPLYGNAKALDAVHTVAKELGATANQVALAWLLKRRDPQAFALMGPRTWEQFETIVPAIDVRLSDEQFQHLEDSA
ncbi:aldo/keto reductase [Virgisporangium aurantiacum]|uniref:Aldo/keto reductase n=1 Tax=Virgisporangium aurantiacum TaxID=175570 RepID=A0A8J4DXQ9_9ACTN|nr:aldo/keto reductase [Virgisporangium aurantiacum]GIJ53623.1 aldo/keto reductase [Virgisporangium aurantiacum]